MHRNLKLFTWVGMIVLLPIGSSSAVRGAEIRLRHECRIGGTVVRLGDVAEVLTGDARQTHQLADIELFPAPANGQKRFVRLREVQDALQLRGLNLAEHRLSGASQIEISGPTEAKAAAPPTAVSSFAVRQVKRAVRDAIVDHLRRSVSADDPWDVEFEVTEDQVRQIASAEKDLVASGGASPWVGEQVFTVALQSEAAGGKWSIDARVTLPPMTVVAVRSLPRGAIVHISDLKLERGRDTGAASDAFGRLDDVVGKEVARSLAAGQIVRPDAVRSPLVVKRGEVVTVYARSSGLVVRTTARARDDGSAGDLITVESLLNRQTFFARVTGVQQVEVFAQAIDATTAARETVASTANQKNLQQERAGP